MELINFKYSDELNLLRKKMQAEFNNWDSSVQWDSLDSINLLKKLNSITGLDVKFCDITINEDGSFSYLGQRVLVYIRDQYSHFSEYKYHISNCSTIRNSQKSNRYDRYVASTRNDNRFEVNIINNVSNTIIEKGIIKELKVCKNCLNNLNYNNYHNSNYEQRNEIYQNFSLKEYFKKENSTFINKPKFTDKTAQANIYSKNFRDISSKLRKKKNWICEECKRDFSKNKSELHVHHINGIKSDNSPNNLKVLCSECHSNQPGHEHMKYSHII